MWKCAMMMRANKYEPVQLPQDFRSFDFLSPWEAMTHVQNNDAQGKRVLPGDEKATTVKPS
jgi:NADH-quinone oxidoreductase subunit C